MSIQLLVELEKNGEVVLSYRIPGGYTEVRDSATLMLDLILDIDMRENFLRKWKRDPLPAFDKATLYITKDETITIPGEAFQFLFTTRELERAGVDVGTLIHQTERHLASLGHLIDSIIRTHMEQTATGEETHGAVIVTRYLLDDLKAKQAA